MSVEAEHPYFHRRLEKKTGQDILGRNIRPNSSQRLKLRKRENHSLVSKKLLKKWR